MRVAIVGAGVSGLVTAHLLHRAHDLTLFEAGSKVGGHVNTVRVALDDRSWEVDTGFIVYNERNYPNFSRLLADLGVETQPTTMSFSVRCESTGLEYNGSTVRQLFAQKRNLLRPSFYRMLRDILRFNREASANVARFEPDCSLGEYLERGRFSEEFTEHYLIPMASAIWSVPRRQVLDMPTEFFVRFFDNHGMLTVNNRPQWRVISGGSQRYVDALVGSFNDRIRLNTAIHRVLRHEDRVEVNGESFDQVIFACHSDQALRILGDATPTEREVLGSLPYQANEVTLHTDTTLLPRKRGAWAAWNYRLTGADDAPATVTYNMNILQSLSASRTLCVSLNTVAELDPAKILFTTQYHHPVYTTGGTAAQRRRAEISGVRRTHYCGAYWGNGFHEDGVNSALDVAAWFGAAP